jgi:hypothetical protein
MELRAECTVEDLRLTVTVLGLSARTLQSHHKGTKTLSYTPDSSDLRGDLPPAGRHRFSPGDRPSVLVFRVVLCLGALVKSLGLVRRSRRKDVNTFPVPGALTCVDGVSSNVRRPRSNVPGPRFTLRGFRLGRGTTMRLLSNPNLSPPRHQGTKKAAHEMVLNRPRERSGPPRGAASHSV